jgi:hypothetical protein
MPGDLANPLALAQFLFHNFVFCTVGASFCGLLKYSVGSPHSGITEVLSPHNALPTRMLSPCANPQSDLSPYPGSSLSVSQLLAALDRKIPAEIAWYESNARFRGALAHFRKPEV